MAPPSSWGFDQATAVRVKIHKDPADGVQVGDRLRGANFQLPTVPSHFSNGEFVVNSHVFLWVKDWLKLPDHSFKAYLCCNFVVTGDLLVHHLRGHSFISLLAAAGISRKIRGGIYPLYKFI